MPKLETLTLPNGASNGKVLTSDASGVATWQTPAAGGGGGAGAGPSYIQASPSGFTTLPGSGSGYTQIATGPLANSSTPAPATRNPNGTWTIVADGVYALAGAMNFSDPLAAGARAQFTMFVNGTTSILGIDTGHASWPAGNVSWQGKLLAGDVVSLCVYMDTNQSQRVVCQSFSISAVGATGPQGAKGDPGDPQTPVTPDHIRCSLSSTLIASTWKDATIAKTDGSGDAAALTVSGAAEVTIRDAGLYLFTCETSTPASANRHLHAVVVNGVNLWQPDTSQITGIAGVGLTKESSVAWAVGANSKVKVSLWSQTAGAAAGVLSITRLVQGQPGPEGGNAPVPMDTWHVVGTAGEPAFAGGCSSDPSEPVAFRKNPDGRVVMRGILLTPVSGANNPFQLPAGYRPPRGYVRLAIIANTAANAYAGVGRCYIGAGGDMGVDGVATGGRWDMSAVEFDTESATTMLSGPRGDPGAPGTGTGKTEVAIQTAAPSPRDDVLLWIDTDEPQSVYTPPTTIAISNLPLSPYHGQEFYVELGLAPWNIWHVIFRGDYHSTDGYGWEVLGGNSQSSDNIVVGTRASTAYGDLSDAANSPSVYVPRDGIYDLAFGAYLRCNQAGGSGMMSVQGAGLTVSDSNYCAQFDSGGANYGGSVMFQRGPMVLLAGPLNCYYRASVNTVTAGRRWIKIEPKRLKS